jgi:hypothetical protein
MIVKHISRLAFLGAAFAFIGIGTSNAQIIITPTSANASSEKGVSLASNTIDGSGLFTDATQTVADNSISGIHFTDQSGFEDDNGWVWEDGSTTPSNPVINGEWIEFDLGAQYELSGAYVWQTTFSTTGRQTRTFDIDTSTDDVSYTTKLTNALLPQVTTLTDGSTATYFDFGTTVTARYVRFEINGTYENTSGTNNWLGGIGEAKFEAVPEPSSVALLLLGLGGLFALRCKTK